MAFTSNTLRIVDLTIINSSETEQKFTAPFNVVTYRIHNNHAAADLLIKTDDNADDLNSIIVEPETATDWVPPVPNAGNGHDLSGLRFRSASAGHSFTVEYVKG